MINCKLCKFIKEIDCTWFCRIEMEHYLKELAEIMGCKVGDIYRIISISITGRTTYPPLFDILNVLGEEKTLKRIENAIKKLEE